MLVSNFTVGFHGFPPYEETWMSRYELLVTNLADVAITFDLEWRITDTYFSGVDRHLPVTTSLSTALSGTWYKDLRGYYSHSIGHIIGPDKSSTFLLQPDDIFGDGRLWAEEVNGYAVLRVPVVRSSQSPYGLVPQSKTAIPVLLNAVRSQRWLKRKPGGVAFHEYSRDLITTSQSSFPLASGKALNEIPAETQPYEHPIGVREYFNAVKDNKIAPARGSLGLPEEDRVQATLDLLTQLTSDQSDLDALNSMLEASGSVVRVVGSDSPARS